MEMAAWSESWVQGEPLERSSTQHTPSPIQEGAWPQREAQRRPRQQLSSALPFGLSMGGLSRAHCKHEPETQIVSKFGGIFNQLAQLGYSKRQLQPQWILLSISISCFHLSLEVQANNRGMERSSSKKEKENNGGGRE